MFRAAAREDVLITLLQPIQAMSSQELEENEKLWLSIANNPFTMASSHTGIRCRSPETTGHDFPVPRNGDLSDRCPRSRLGLLLKYPFLVLLDSATERSCNSSRYTNR